MKKKLSLDLEQVLVQFQIVSKHCATASREWVNQAKTQQSLLLAEEEAQEDEPLLGRHEQLVHLQTIDHQVQLNEAIIQEREQELVVLEQSIVQVNEIFRDLGTLVNEQQFLLGI